MLWAIEEHALTPEAVEQVIRLSEARRVAAPQSKACCETV